MSVDEGEVGQGAAGEGIDYGAVTSCMTVTLVLDDGSYVGGHLSLLIPQGALDSTSVLPAMANLVGGRQVTWVHLAGQSDTWNTAYLDDPLFQGTGEGSTQNPAYPNQLASNDLSGTICGYFGVDTSICSQEDREGAFTIKFS
jgi:hypothetical protein